MGICGAIGEFIQHNCGNLVSRNVRISGKLPLVLVPMNETSTAAGSVSTGVVLGVGNFVAVNSVALELCYENAEIW